MGFVLRNPPVLKPRNAAFPYQIEAIESVRDMPYAAVFHEQGLGKTKIAIDIALYWLERDVVDTVFIVTKKSLVHNWINEIAMHSLLKPRVLSDDRRANGYALNGAVLIYVMNYEVCLGNKDLIEAFQKTCRVGVILDESQKIKNPDAMLTNCYLQLADGFERRIIMTGTPVANRPYDLWSQIYFLDGGKSLGADFKAFKSEVDIPKSGANENYAENLESINKKIAPFTVRETKKSSGIELPEKIIRTYSVEMSLEQTGIYESYKNGLRFEIVNEFGTQLDDAEAVLKRLLRLVQCASNPFLIDKSYMERPAKLIKLHEIFGSEIKGDKAIVWTSFIDNAEWLAPHFPDKKPVIVHGSKPIESRIRAIDRFKQDDDCRMLVATPGAAKEGLTLTVANHAIFYDRGFSLDDYLQAQDRIHRISQQQKCFIHNLVAKDTIDEWIDSLLYAKYIIAQIAQGDISKTQGAKMFRLDLTKMLSEILHPTQESKETLK